MSADISLERKRKDYCNALDEALQRIVDGLSHIPEVERAILFGSYAHGRRDLFTDLDLVVVMDSQAGFIQRGGDLRMRLGARVDLDLLVYTPAEFESMAGYGFLRRVVETGRVIYEKTAT